MRERNHMYDIPVQYQPISAWGYIGYEILFTIPVVGFIALLICSFGKDRNVNVKNYARSYLAVLVIIAVITIILTVFLGVSIPIRSIMEMQ